MTTEIATVQQSAVSPFGSADGFDACYKMAKALSESTFIPKDFRGNLGDCLILLETASRTNMPIMALMQNMYVVHGKPSFSSAFMAGLINNSRRFDGPLRFVYNNDRTACYAVATANGQEYRSITITMDIARKEGWVDKKGSKWQTMPELMLQYRATSFFARAYCADLIMGMRSDDELIDISVTHENSSPAVDLNDIINSETVDTTTGEIKNPVSSTKKDTPKKSENAIAAFRAEIDAIKHSTHLDRWRFKHKNRIARELPNPGDQDAVYAYAQEHYLKLQAAEIEPMPPHPADEPAEQKNYSQDSFVNCPNGNGNVSVLYCNSECKARPGCPAFNDGPGSKLTMEV